MDVSRETQERLTAYAELIRKWSPRINLVASSTLADIETRHIQDSVVLVRRAPDTSSSWVDLGSGGGLPGVVAAILRPDCDVTLIESDGRKATFLRTVIRDLGLRARVVAARIEAVDPLQADVVSARALAPLPRLLGYARRHSTDGTRMLFAKGRSWAIEEAEARHAWRYDLTVHPGASGDGGVILELTNVRERDE
jgi:16S rRNA (guanine527-N7)-methyltransferase